MTGFAVLDRLGAGAAESFVASRAHRTFKAKIIWGSRFLLDFEVVGGVDDDAADDAATEEALDVLSALEDCRERFSSA